MRIYKVTYYTCYYGEYKTHIEKFFNNKAEAQDFSDFLEICYNDFEDNILLKEVEMANIRDSLGDILAAHEDILKDPFWLKHKKDSIDFLDKIIKKYS